MKALPGRSLAILLVVLLSFSSLTIFNVKAQPRTITVPDDYPKIQEAINNANDEDIIFVREGTYQEKTLNITKPLSIIGENTTQTTIILDPPLINKTIMHYTYEAPSTAIEINSNNVEISNFTIDMPSELIATGDKIQLANNNFTFGSLILSGRLISILENSINGYLTINGSNNTIQKNFIQGDLNSQDNYNIIAQNTVNLDIKLKSSSFNLISGNSVDIIYFEHCHSNLVCNNTFRSLWLGFQGNPCYNNTICKNKAIGQYHWGILIGDGSNNIIHDNLISNYTDGYGIATGGNHLTAEHNLFYRNILINNDVHVGANWEINGEGNSWDNGKEGNYWDNYSGEDLNGDGIGDIPYEVEGCKWEDGLVPFTYGQDNYPLIDPFDIDNIIVDYPKWVYSLLNIELPNPTPTPIPEVEFPTTQVLVIIITILAGFGILAYSMKKRKP